MYTDDPRGNENGYANHRFFSYSNNKLYKYNDKYNLFSFLNTSVFSYCIFFHNHEIKCWSTRVRFFTFIPILLYYDFFFFSQRPPVVLYTGAKFQLDPWLRSDLRSEFTGGVPTRGLITRVFIILKYILLYSCSYNIGVIKTREFEGRHRHSVDLCATYNI